MPWHAAFPIDKAKWRRSLIVKPARKWWRSTNLRDKAPAIWISLNIMEYHWISVEYPLNIMEYPLNIMEYHWISVEYPLNIMEYPLNVHWKSLNIMEYHWISVEYPLDIIEYPLNIMEYPLNIMEYHWISVEYPLNIMEYPLNVHWKSLNIMEYHWISVEYPLDIIEYPLNIIEYPLNVHWKSLNIMEYHWIPVECPLNIIENHWISLNIIEYHWISIEYPLNITEYPLTSYFQQWSVLSPWIVGVLWLPSPLDAPVHSRSPCVVILELRFPKKKHTSYIIICIHMLHNVTYRKTGHHLEKGSICPLRSFGSRRFQRPWRKSWSFPKRSRHDGGLRTHSVGCWAPKGTAWAPKSPENRMISTGWGSSELNRSVGANNYNNYRWSIDVWYLNNYIWMRL